MSTGKISISLLIICLIAWSCSKHNSQKATMLIFGGTIYTVDSLVTVEAIATKDDKIIFTGSLEEAEEFKGKNTKLIDLKGKTMTPGLIEGHGHFMGLGYNELNLDLMNTTSYQAIVDAVSDRVKLAKPGDRKSVV